MQTIKLFFQTMPFKQRVALILLLCLLIGSFLFVHSNHSFYEQDIAQIIESKTKSTTNTEDMFQNKDVIVSQLLIAELKNGDHKGERIELQNDYSYSQGFDQNYEIGTEVFVRLSKDPQGPLKGIIDGVKRDKYLVMIGWIFVLVLLAVGKRQGFFSIISLAINIGILSLALDLYTTSQNQSLLWICVICIVLFTVTSLLLVNGINEKTFAAIIATLIGTFLSLAITFIALKITGENGLRYEELQFLTRPYKTVFMAGLFIGSLGAVMDVAITMSSSLFGLYEENPHISIKALTKSGMEIGKDIMGTMTNILFFAYVSGSIPMLLLYFKNASAFGYTLSLNLSLELVRALAGGIGIVITIPIGLYTALFFIQRKKVKQ